MKKVTMMVAALLGNGSVPSNLVYSPVGLSALYQEVGFGGTQRRWAVQTH